MAFSADTALNYQRINQSLNQLSQPKRTAERASCRFQLHQMDYINSLNRPLGLVVAPLQRLTGTGARRPRGTNMTVHVSAWHDRKPATADLYGQTMAAAVPCPV